MDPCSSARRRGDSGSSFAAICINRPFGGTQRASSAPRQQPRRRTWRPTAAVVAGNRRVPARCSLTRPVARGIRGSYPTARSRSRWKLQDGAADSSPRTARRSRTADGSRALGGGRLAPELREASDRLAPQGGGRLGDRRLTRTVRLRSPAIQCPDDLVKPFDDYLVARGFSLGYPPRGSAADGGAGQVIHTMHTCSPRPMFPARAPRQRRQRPLEVEAGSELPCRVEPRAAREPLENISGAVEW
jgi:hypothetical protein